MNIPGGPNIDQRKMRDIMSAPMNTPYISGILYWPWVIVLFLMIIAKRKTPKKNISSIDKLEKAAIWFCYMLVVVDMYIGSSLDGSILDSETSF